MGKQRYYLNHKRIALHIVHKGMTIVRFSELYTGDIAFPYSEPDKEITLAEALQWLNEHVFGQESEYSTIHETITHNQYITWKSSLHTI